ncbi:MAG: GxxExxY protein [Terriglobia bacterium]|jgi:hypothetical protein
MDKQDGQDRELKHELTTKGAIGCAFEVINELGAGFLESVDEKALLLALRQEGFSALSQHPVKDISSVSSSCSIMGISEVAPGFTRHVPPSRPSRDRFRAALQVNAFSQRNTRQGIQDFLFRFFILSILPIYVNNGPHSKASHQHPP